MRTFERIQPETGVRPTTQRPFLPRAQASALGAGAAIAVLVLAGCGPAGRTPMAAGTGGGPADAGPEASLPGAGGAHPPGSGGTATGGRGPGAAGAAGTGGAGAAGAAGTGGAGAAGMGGAGAGGAAGIGGRGGEAGRSAGAGSGGAALVISGNPVTCTIAAEAVLSPAIPTVGIVTWSTDLANVDAAEIQFGLATTGPTMEAPVDLTEADHRTLLLGMKGDHAYVFRIVAHAGGDACTSRDYTLTTGPVSSTVPVPIRQVVNEGAHARGFIVTSGGVDTGQGGPPGLPAYILDGDGDVVWWTAAPANTSRAHMSWDGANMWMLRLNVSNVGGEVRRVSMDGMDTETNVSGLGAAHHDFTVLPDGSVATLLWNTAGMDAHNALVERAADGTITTVVADLATIYASATFHPNAIHYHPSDDSYTISDRNVSLFVKVTRQGQLVWQLGGKNPKGPAFQVLGTAWQVNHGHQLLENGNFLFFSNGPLAGGVSGALEYALDTTAWTATKVWSYQASGVNSNVLGDVQRLPNGNTLVTYSTAGTIHEVDPSGKLVMSLETSTFGYADFRESLYGPPPR